ncbi:Hydroxyproline-rich glycoprotein family protein [Rhynchospora pubera]|uniref:Hydroxyproline-rich glycoprotein family protein n=1 Tax=Rhynchospora pubera TaxID=906938 RepID=A0AAV8HM73_9POAL|nr:Hydroxyproline-rich glycoprotein family protein [Rhynchospora pubera]
MGHSGDRKMKGEKDSVEKREGRTSQPILINIGVAIAFSFAGFVLSQIGATTRPHSNLPSSVIEGEEDEEPCCNPAEDKCNFTNGEAHIKTKNDSAAIHTATSATVTFSPTKSSSGDEEGYLLPEFDDLVLEGFGSSMPDSDPVLNLNPTPIVSTGELENEVTFLRNMVCSLQEREKSLELQLLEVFKLKEQENSISQLKNQLKVKNEETKLYMLKMRTLLSENQRLRVQLSENSRTMAQLEEAREQIRVLTNKVQLLREEMEQMCNGGEERAKRMEELEDEVKDLKFVNALLEKEKLDLVHQLQLQKVDLQIDTTFHTSKEAEAIEEAENLRQEIAKLSNEIEQLKTSRCADLEELVYLKWINACLRYELRDHPAHDKTLARDLSMTLSPNSKEKAKQLIQEYAHYSVPTSDDSNWEYSSESSGDSSKISNSNKLKLFGKLKHFVFGKDEKRIDSTGDGSRISSWGSASSCMTEESALPVHLQRPLDSREQLVRSISDVGLGYRRKGVVPVEVNFSGNNFHGTGFNGSEIPEKIRLKRLADALEEPIGENIDRRAASFSFTTFNASSID